MAAMLVLDRIQTPQPNSLGPCHRRRCRSIAPIIARWRTNHEGPYGGQGGHLIEGLSDDRLPLTLLMAMG